MTVSRASESLHERARPTAGTPIALTPGMADFHRIMVAVSDPDDDGPAVNVASALAHRLDAELVVLHVNDAMAIVPGSNVATRLGAEDRAFLDRLVTRMNADGVRARGMLRAGVPAHDIAGIAASECCDLLVIGDHGRNPFAAALLGTVGQKVLHGARCPVLVVPERHAA